MNFLEELSRRGIIQESQIQSIINLADEKFGGDIDDALAQMGFDEKKLLTIKSEFFRVPMRMIDVKKISLDLLKYIPEASATNYKFAPIGLVDNTLEVGITDPSNVQGLDALQFIAGKLNVPFKIFLISKQDYNKIIQSYKGITGEVDQALSEIDNEIADTAADQGVETGPAALKPGEEEKIVEDAPIIKIVAVILRHATEGNASDIHVENTGDKVKVRFRVDGVLHTSLILPQNVFAGVVARIKILAKLRLDEKRKPQDGNFSAKIDGRKIDFRVSTLPAVYGEKVELRVLDADKGVKSISDIGLSKENLALIKAALARPYGLILITGPTGSGKTTTLYSILNELDREKENVISLEDPVEYHIPDVSQSQMMPEIGYTFAAGLRSVLRQDPDIIMVGEIRDNETAELAIQAALTGHLVFSTLHTNNATGIVPRLIDMGVDPYLIAPTLILGIAQRLVSTIYPTSKHAVPVDDAIKSMIEKQFADLPDEIKTKLPLTGQIHEAIPSAECPSGTRGRTAVFEMFAVDKEMETTILKRPTQQDIYALARRKGMLTMREDAIIKSMEGTVPFIEVYNL